MLAFDEKDGLFLFPIHGINTQNALYHNTLVSM